MEKYTDIHRVSRMHNSVLFYYVLSTLACSHKHYTIVLVYENPTRMRIFYAHEYYIIRNMQIERMKFAVLTGQTLIHKTLIIVLSAVGSSKF